jgi:hypothetical protein
LAAIPSPLLLLVLLLLLALLHLLLHWHGPVADKCSLTGMRSCVLGTVCVRMTASSNLQQLHGHVGRAQKDFVVTDECRRDSCKGRHNTSNQCVCVPNNVLLELLRSQRLAKRQLEHRPDHLVHCSGEPLPQLHNCSHVTSAATTAVAARAQGAADAAIATASVDGSSTRNADAATALCVVFAMFLCVSNRSGGVSHSFSRQLYAL